MMPNHIMMSAPAGGANGLLQRMDEGQASQIKQKQAVEIAQHTMDALPLYGLHTLCTADSPPATPTQHPGSLSSGSLLSSRLFSRSSWNIEQVLWCHNCSDRATSCHESWEQRLIPSIQTIVKLLPKLRACLSVPALFTQSQVKSTRKQESRYNSWHMNPQMKNWSTF